MITQINVLIDIFIASFIENGISYIYYAERLNQFPQSIIGVSISTVIFPLISKKNIENNKDNIIKIQNKAITIGLILVMPIASVFLIIPETILLIFFSYGNFSYYTIQKISSILIAFSFSLPASIINKILLTTFFANGNLKKLILISLKSLIINIIFNFILINKYHHTSIAIAASISIWIKCILIINYLRKNNIFKINKILIFKITKIIIATLVMSIVLRISNSFLLKLLLGKIFANIIHLLLLFFLCIITYFSAIFLLFTNSFKYIKL